MNTKYEIFYTMKILFCEKIDPFLIRVHAGAFLSIVSEMVIQEIIQMKKLESWVPNAMISARV